ncbi:MAG: 2-oxoacid:acceptor oxidoreductase subunit alpha [Candidatus Caenarcaniphilales bacterium]|nr:2-oxoacid:acceptor oxidoreductase subunit alpha [Candidatus Caenarcaniphilales bacterium]
MSQTKTVEEIETIELDRVVIRFAGDSGDGMQVTGGQFTTTSAIAGNSLATFPDYPAEIRAPQGTLPGVSGFQIQLGEIDIYTAGDEPDVLVAMNPAALKVNIKDIKKGGTIIVNQDAFTKTGLDKAGYASNPIEDDSLSSYRVIPTQITKLTRLALEESKLDSRSKDRCKNFFALGLMYWIYSRPLETTKDWIKEKFAKKPDIVDANLKALQAGYNYGITVEALPTYVVKSATIQPGKYRNITGNQATILGLIAASQKSSTPIFLGSYPITPASDILHELSKYKEFGVVTFQAEDEIAAVCSAIGASFGGAIGVTSTSGPGLALKSEAVGLAVKTELPLVIIDVQRAGPSTGMPTKTEQSDLLFAMYGRHGESPVCILAPSTPSDCYEMAFEATRLALEFMTPVILLSDGYLANGSEPWLIPSSEELPIINNHLIDPQKSQDEPFLPYSRDENLVRNWAIPGMAGFEHRISGLEGQEGSGSISYDPENHERMTETRKKKIKNIQKSIPPLEVFGETSGDLLVLGWGGTYGTIRAAVEELQKEGKSVSQAHLRYLNPFPSNFEEVLRSYNKVLVPEINDGQLSRLIKADFLINAHCLNKVQGQPFKVRELKEAVSRLIEN